MTRRPIALPLFRSTRPPGLRAGAVAVPVLAGLLMVSTAAFARIHYHSLQQTRMELASDGATLLALGGVQAFIDQAESMALMTLPVGADSMVMKARIFDEDRSMGTWAVSLRRVEIGGFRFLATGRLVSGERSMICSVRGQVQFDETTGDRISVGYDAVPLCNGARHQLSLTTQLGS